MDENDKYKCMWWVRKIVEQNNFILVWHLYEFQMVVEKKKKILITLILGGTFVRYNGLLHKSYSVQLYSLH